MEAFPDIYPLISLQIGNIKSHLSRTFLYFAPVSNKFLILVDNQSWRINKPSRSAHIRELMSTKYRRSPFRNTRALLRSSSFGYRSSSNHERKNLYKWLPAIDFDSLKEKTPFSIMNLYKALHGFIVFEVAWIDACGINYLNELQRDASMALEVKSMRKWEFNSIDQALSSISSWFSGTLLETRALQNNLILLHEKVPSRSSLRVKVASKELLLNNSSQAELFSEDVFFDVREYPIETNDKCIIDCKEKESKSMKREEITSQESKIEPMRYNNTLLLFRFNHRDLPCKLSEIITSDLKLLALLEAGLPSWVILLQSYPVFCKAYRPWMQPLLRTVYILISLITVIIGFYDLYKNVPLLKATASHLCGPLFNWIESWDMASRIRYLGTMLFLQNLEKPLKWFLVMAKTMRPMMLPLIKPLMHPLEAIIEFIEPVWAMFVDIMEDLYMSSTIMIKPLCSLVVDFVEVLLSPFQLLHSCILTLVTLICSLLSSIWELLLFPGRGCLALAHLGSYIFSNIYEVVEGTFLISGSNMNQLKYLSQVKAHNSFWHSLWHDLLSKVFWSLRNIIRGLVSFFSSCNRHRLSIYSHLRAILWKLCHVLRLDSRRFRGQPVREVASHLEIK